MQTPKISFRRVIAQVGYATLVESNCGHLRIWNNKEDRWLTSELFFDDEVQVIFYRMVTEGNKQVEERING